MSVKLIQFWNIRHGCLDGFGQFFTHMFIPKINETGQMKMIASWYAASGEGPSFIAEGMSDNLEDVQSLVMGEKFAELRQELFRLVSDYHTKLLVPKNFTETDPIDIEKGFKFTQHFNVNPAETFAYNSFFRETYVPRMRKWGIGLVGEWNVAVGATPYVVIETRAKALDTFGELLENAEYHRLTRDLLNMVSGYGCKILVPSGHLNL
jgi:hypothetical protein